MGKCEIASVFLILSCLKDLSQNFILGSGSILPLGERGLCLEQSSGLAIVLSKRGLQHCVFPPSISSNIWPCLKFSLSSLLQEQRAIMIFILHAPVFTKVPGCLLSSKSLSWKGLTLRTAGTTVGWKHLSIPIFSPYLFIHPTALINFPFLPFFFRILFLPRHNEGSIKIWLMYP